MDIGIDLGTANVMISMGNKGVVLNEPSVVAFNKKLNEVIAVGEEAYRMVGRTPEHITVVRPLSDGVISDHKMTKLMIMAFIEKVTGKQLFMPNIVMCVPSSITDVESRAVIEAAKNAGARQVYLIDEPVAAIMGAGVDISRADGNMVVDIGGGTTDIAVVSMNGVVTSHTIKNAGNSIDRAIVKYLQNKYKLLIGERTAEKLKIELCNLYDPTDEVTYTVKGRSLAKGLPAQIQFSQIELYQAIEDETFLIMEAIRKVLEDAPPELVGDIYDNGLLLTGGGALLGGLTQLIKRTLGINCSIAKDAVNCVAKGTGMAFGSMTALLDGFEAATVYKYR